MCCTIFQLPFLSSQCVQYGVFLCGSKTFQQTFSSFLCGKIHVLISEFLCIFLTFCSFFFCFPWPSKENKNSIQLGNTHHSCVSVKICDIVFLQKFVMCYYPMYLPTGIGVTRDRVQVVVTIVLKLVLLFYLYERNLCFNAVSVFPPLPQHFSPLPP